MICAWQFETDAELRAQLAAVEDRIKAERVRLADVESAAPKQPTWELGPSGTFERKDWACIRAGETKTFYTLLEQRDVLQLRIAYPDHEFLEQVSINRVVTKDGQVFELPERIADWALVKGDEAILGDKKSATAILSGVKGGIPKNRPTTPADLHGSFRVTAGRFTRGGNPKSRTQFGDQVLKERYAIQRATALDGDVVIVGTDASGTRVERKVPPTGVRISRLNTYGQLPDKLIDHSAAGLADTDAPPAPVRGGAATEPEDVAVTPPAAAGRKGEGGTILPRGAEPGVIPKAGAGQVRTPEANPSLRGRLGGAIVSATAQLALSHVLSYIEARAIKKLDDSVFKQELVRLAPEILERMAAAKWAAAELYETRPDEPIFLALPIHLTYVTQQTAGDLYDGYGPGSMTLLEKVEIAPGPAPVFPSQIRVPEPQLVPPKSSRVWGMQVRVFETILPIPYEFESPGEREALLEAVKARRKEFARRAEELDRPLANIHIAPPEAPIRKPRTREPPEHGPPPANPPTSH